MPKFRKTKIMVFWTFDVLHKGHLHFFKQARSLSANPFLIVSVARDINVKKIKGRKPNNSEKKRLMIVATSELVNKAVLGGLKNHLPHILKHRPQIIALGYDQLVYTKNLGTDLKARSLEVKIIRLKAHRPNKYKTSILGKKVV